MAKDFKEVAGNVLLSSILIAGCVGWFLVDWLFGVLAAIIAWFAVGAVVAYMIRDRERRAQEYADWGHSSDRETAPEQASVVELAPPARGGVSVTTRPRASAQGGGRLLMRYIDGGGATTERELSSVKIRGDEMDGFCHFRQERRTFKLFRIIDVADAETGEVYADPWTAADDRPSDARLMALWEIRWPLAALLRFLSETRGDSSRERCHITSFAEEFHGASPGALNGLITHQKVALPYIPSDVYDQSVAALIPPNLVPSCRAAAARIIQGSGRKPPDQEWLEILDWWFPEKERVT